VSDAAGSEKAAFDEPENSQQNDEQPEEKEQMAVAIQEGKNGASPVALAVCGARRRFDFDERLILAEDVVSKRLTDFVRHSHVCDKIGREP
jgi:hypothetical protein